MAQLRQNLNRYKIITRSPAIINPADLECSNLKKREKVLVYLNCKLILQATKHKELPNSNDFDDFTYLTHGRSIPN